jgi:hypothetical protein
MQVMRKAMYLKFKQLMLQKFKQLMLHHILLLAALYYCEGY